MPPCSPSLTRKAELTPTAQKASTVGLGALTLPCHLWPGRAFLPRDSSRRRGAMDGSPADGWEGELERWLAPFLARLGRKERRRRAPLYPKGPIPPGERKRIQAKAARVGPRNPQQPPHLTPP